MKRVLLTLGLASISICFLPSCGESFPNVDPNYKAITATYEDTNIEYGSLLEKSKVKIDLEYEDKTVSYTGNDVILDADTFKTGEIKVNASIRGNPDVKDDFTLSVTPRTNFKLLFIGNSFSVDTAQWMYEIANSLNISVEIQNMYIGGCDIDTHYENIKNNNAAYDWYKRVENKWVPTRKSTLKDALLSEDWDYISFQQASHYSGMLESYSNLNNLLNKVHETLPKDSHAQFVWNMTWAYQSDSDHWAFSQNYQSNQQYMYSQIVKAINEKVKLESQIKTIIPNGTAIQNARTSYLGDTFTKDGYHLTENLGRYIAGLTTIKALTGQDINECQFTTTKGYPTFIAKESVDNAILSKTEVTQSKYPQDPLNLENIQNNYYKVPLNDISCGYYDATDNENPSTLKNDESDPLVKQYCATEIISTDTLKEEAVIYVKAGYGYVPVGWNNLNENVSEIPTRTMAKLNLIDRFFIREFKYRAFNINRNDGMDLTENEINQIINGEIFTIYLPN